MGCKMDLFTLSREKVIGILVLQMLFSGTFNEASFVLWNKFGCNDPGVKESAPLTSVVERIFVIGQILFNHIVRWQHLSQIKNVTL